MQRIDTLQAELNATQADKAAAEAAAAGAKDRLVQLESSLAQAQRQLDILGNNSSNKETQLQELRAEQEAANHAKTGLELQVGQRRGVQGRSRAADGIGTTACCIWLSAM